MEDETTTVAVNQDDASTASTTATDTTSTTDSGTTDDSKASDNSDSSKTTDDSSSNSTDADTTSAPKFDTDLDEWAEKTKRPVPESDRERALYQEIRDSQRDFSRSKQAKDASQSVEKAIETAKPADNKLDDDDDERDPVEIRQDTIEAQLTQERNLRMRGEYFNEQSVTAEQSDVMGKILQEKVDRAKTPEAKSQAFNYWTHPDQLQDWHELAKARLNSVSKDTTVIEEEAARKERERIAKESQASGGNRNASNNGPAKKQGYNRTEFLKS